MTINRTPRIPAAAIALGFVLVSCSSGSPSGGGQSQVGRPATISHIHGLGVDAAGTLHVATHFGLIKAAADGSWVYASRDTNDHMGFSLHPGAGVMYRSGHAQSRPSLGVESSTDGAQWTHLDDVAAPPVDFHAMAVSFADAKTLWGWDSGGRGTFRSTDGGNNWTRLETRGLERQIYVLAGPSQANVVLAGTVSGLYRSSDGGRSWNRMLGDAQVIAIAADPKEAEHQLAFTQEGMKATTDGGATWTVVGGGLPPNAELTSLAISPTDPNVAYAADASTIYQSADGGKTWSAMDAGA